MRPAIVPRIVTGGASVRYWSTSSLSLLTVPDVLATVNLAHVDHSFFKYCPQILCQIFYERKNMTKEDKKLGKLTSVIITSHDLIIKIFSLYGAMWIKFITDNFPHGLVLLTCINVVFEANID